MADRRVTVLGDVPPPDPDMIADIDAWLQGLNDEGSLVEVIPSAKMSKSKKNVVDPMNIIEAFGADTARWFVMSDSPPERDVEWTASGAEATFKHLSRVWALCSRIGDMPADHQGEGDQDIARATAKAVDEVTRSIETFAFNKAIAALYGLTNTLAKANGSTAAMKASHPHAGATDVPDDAAYRRIDLELSGRRRPLRHRPMAQGRSGAADRRYRHPADPDQRQTPRGNQRARKTCPHPRLKRSRWRMKLWSSSSQARL